MSEIKKEERTTAKLSKEASRMLSEMSKRLSTEKCAILEEFITCLNSCFDYASKTSHIGFVISPLEGLLTVQILPKEQWKLVQKRIKKDMAKKALKGD